MYVVKTLETGQTMEFATEPEALRYMREAEKRGFTVVMVGKPINKVTAGEWARAWEAAR